MGCVMARSSSAVVDSGFIAGLLCVGWVVNGSGRECSDGTVEVERLGDLDSSVVSLAREGDKDAVGDLDKAEHRAARADFDEVCCDLGDLRNGTRSGATDG